jgi:hypothetical protein
VKANLQGTQNGKEGFLDSPYDGRIISLIGRRQDIAFAALMSVDTRYVLGGEIREAELVLIQSSVHLDGMDRNF